jgi:hypothetical protein
MVIVVFAGPTLAPADYPRNDPRLRWAPPARRGDLLAAAQDPDVETVVLLDGVVEHALAVRPEEIREVATAPVRVIGAAGVGALRAVECLPVPNVHGVGLVYSLYRDGKLVSDDEVTVVTDPEQEHRQVSTSLIDIRIGLQRALRERLVALPDARAVLAAAAALPYHRRTWSAAFRVAGCHPSPEAEHFLRASSQKRTDGVRAIDHAVAVTGTEPLGARGPVSLPRRHRGVSPLLGEEKPVAKRALLRWIFGSGRYEQLSWPMVVPRLRRRHPPATAADVREDALDAVGDLLADEDRAADLLWEELEYRGELTRMLFWLTSARARADEVTPSTVAAALAHIAVRHGYDTESALMDDVVDDRLMGIIPAGWVRDAATVEAAILSARR